MGIASRVCLGVHARLRVLANSQVATSWLHGARWSLCRVGLPVRSRTSAIPLSRQGQGGPGPVLRSTLGGQLPCRLYRADQVTLVNCNLGLVCQFVATPTWARTLCIHEHMVMFMDPVLVGVCNMSSTICIIVRLSVSKVMFSSGGASCTAVRVAVPSAFGTVLSCPGNSAGLREPSVSLGAVAENQNICQKSLVQVPKEQTRHL